MTRIYFLAKDWVVEQTIERVRRELEADEEEYEMQYRYTTNRRRLRRCGGFGANRKQPHERDCINVLTSGRDMR